MHKKHIVSIALMLIVLGIGSILLTACSSTNTSSTGSANTGNTGGYGEPTVHLDATNFAQPTVTVPKKLKLKLIDDGAYVHNLENGSWNNGAAVSNIEPGAPLVSNMRLDGQTVSSVEIGPFKQAGTFQLICTIHSGMELTIVVLDTNP